MKRNRFELPPDRLSFIDETGAHISLSPSAVRGRFRRRRDWLQPILILVFLAVPWLRIGGQPLLLLDVERGRFAIFGVAFGSHDTPILVFGPLCFAMTVALVTALWGRFWCGWLCPQTVFIEAIFRRLDKKTPVVKWLSSFLVALVLAHTLVAYFVGSDRLLAMMSRAPTEAPGWFLMMAIVTGIVLFNFGSFREQFCVLACPYGRIQSALLDRHSTVVTYDERRGEPRRGQAPEGVAGGDCVNCFRCVQVCPTGIDIRRGSGQLECIGCTACIDACDEVMAKVKRPAGLIRSTSAEKLAGGRDRMLRARTTLYATVLLVSVGALGTGLARHDVVEVSFLRAVGAAYQEVRKENEITVVNQFHAELWNGGTEPVRVDLALSAEALAKGVVLVAAGLPVEVPAGKKIRQDFFVTFPLHVAPDGKGAVDLRWTSPVAGGEEVLSLVGPLR